jgi:hypothetical protein
MLIYSPRWLFLLPGAVLTIGGAIVACAVNFGVLRLGGINFDVGTFAVACASVNAGVLLLAFAFMTKVFAIGEGLLPQDPNFARVFAFFTLERGLAVGILSFVLGLAMLFSALWIWRESEFGMLPYADNLRRIISASTLILLGIQLIGVSFFMSVLGLKTTTRQPPDYQPA